ncbi:hypothetical protein HA402_008027 [Bradysia odoriphaga]|nr:hypothetical protein HA402_008027 [Bradysia odoriphaga]
MSKFTFTSNFAFRACNNCKNWVLKFRKRKPPNRMNNPQPGRSGTTNVPEQNTNNSSSEEMRRSAFDFDDDEQKFENFFMDSDSDEDEDIFLAKQLSLLAMNFEDYSAGGDISGDEENIHVAEQSVCEICTEESDDMISYGCTHYYCRDCIKTNLETAINDGLIDTFNCPEPNCEISASENFVKTVVSTTAFERYETLMIKKAVGDMDDIVYCPREGCDAFIETDGSGRAECWKCFHLLCTLCSKLYHGNTDCDLTEEERTDNFRRIRDEEVAEKILLQETQNALMIEELERENEEWLRRTRREQEEIRRIEQIEQEEEERRMEEERQREEEARQLENQRRREEEFQRLVQENEERERRQRQKQEERRQAERASEDTVLKTTKKCPNCKSPIEKKEGCNAMLCTMCGYRFCWGCLGPEHGHNWVCNGIR